MRPVTRAILWGAPWVCGTALVAAQANDPGVAWVFGAIGGAVGIGGAVERIKAAAAAGEPVAWTRWNVALWAVAVVALLACV